MIQMLNASRNVFDLGRVCFPGIAIRSQVLPQRIETVQLVEDIEAHYGCIGVGYWDRILGDPNCLTTRDLGKEGRFPQGFPCCVGFIVRRTEVYGTCPSAGGTSTA